MKIYSIYFDDAWLSKDRMHVESRDAAILELTQPGVLIVAASGLADLAQYDRFGIVKIVKTSEVSDAPRIVEAQRAEPLPDAPLDDVVFEAEHASSDVDETEAEFSELFVDEELP